MIGVWIDLRDETLLYLIRLSLDVVIALYGQLRVADIHRVELDLCFTFVTPPTPPHPPCAPQSFIRTISLRFISKVDILEPPAPGDGTTPLDSGAAAPPAGDGAVGLEGVTGGKEVTFSVWNQAPLPCRFLFSR